MGSARALNRAAAASASAARSDTPPRLIRSETFLPRRCATDFGLVCLVFVLWGWTPVFLVAYTALCAAAVLFLALAAVKWFREIGRLGDAA